MFFAQFARIIIPAIILFAISIVAIADHSSRVEAERQREKAASEAAHRKAAAKAAREESAARDRAQRQAERAARKRDETIPAAVPAPAPEPIPEPIPEPAKAPPAHEPFAQAAARYFTKGSKAFVGQVVAFTGTLPGMTRREAIEAVEKNGGKAFETMPAATTILVVGDKPGAGKLEKAERWAGSVRKITPMQFMAMVNQPLTADPDEFAAFFKAWLSRNNNADRPIEAMTPNAASAAGCRSLGRGL